MFWNKKKKILDTNYQAIINQLKKERDDTNKRLRELEDSVSQDRSVPLRVEKIVVVADFNKLEMTVMQAAVFKLIGASTNTGDIKFYMELYDKIGGLVKNMEE